jgi:DNA-binding response OmpR family regulator
MITNLLGRANYEVKSAGTISESLTLAKSERFDLYMLDNWFPGGSGVGLCRAIREFDAQTPILFSGAAYESDRREAIEAGAQDYLIKPDIDGIVRTIARLMGDKSWERM